MNNLKELINEHYPITETSWDIVQRSLKSYFDKTSTIIDYESVDPAQLPVFLSKLLNRLEVAGVQIESLDNPFHEPIKSIVCTHKYMYYFGSILDCLPIGYASEEVMSASIDDIVENLKSKPDKISIYTITPEVNKTEYKFNIYIRGVINESKKEEPKIAANKNAKRLHR